MVPCWIPVCLACAHTATVIGVARCSYRRVTTLVAISHAIQRQADGIVK